MSIVSQKVEAENRFSLTVDNFFKICKMNLNVIAMLKDTPKI